MMRTPEQKARNAEARVIEVWDALTRIEQLRDRVRVLIENHDPTKNDNASRRDCERFRERCRELGLTEWAAAVAKSGLLNAASVDAVAPHIVD